MLTSPKYLKQDEQSLALASFPEALPTLSPTSDEQRPRTDSVSLTEAEGAINRSEAAHHGDTDRERILLEMMPAVRHVARRILARLPHYVELDDLISAGVVGLIDAFSKFDHNRQAQFKTYAQFRIRGAILDALRSQDWSPRDLRRKGRSVQQAIQTLTQDLQRKPSDDEVASHLHLSLEDYHSIVGDLKGLEVASLDAEVSEDSRETEMDRIAGAVDDEPLIRCLQGERKQHVTEAIDKLPERERLVLSLYYYEELTMREIAAIFGIVESRASRIHSSALLHLRSSLAAFRLPVC